MTEPDSRLLDLARQVLTLAGDILDGAGYPPPDRRFVAPGRVTTMPGCEALAVVVERVFPGVPGQEARTVPVNCAHPVTAQLAVVLHRCVPTVSDSGLPSGPEMDAAGAALTEQGWVLFLGLQSALATKPGGGQVVGVAGPLEAIRPEGGVGGWRLAVNARV